MKALYNVHFLDVWGNAEEGFEVNDVYPSQATIELDNDSTDEQIVKALQEADVICAGVDLSLFTIEGERGFTLYVGYENCPQLELRTV
jgi:hypothetical protein